MELATLNKKMKINTDGPIVKSLDETLKSLNVCRQAYHGNIISFCRKPCE